MLTLILVIGIYVTIGILLACFAAEFYNQKNSDDYYPKTWNKNYLVTLGIISIPLFWGLGLALLPVALLVLPFWGIQKLGSYAAKEIINPKLNVKA